MMRKHGWRGPLRPVSSDKSVHTVLFQEGGLKRQEPSVRG